MKIVNPTCQIPQIDNLLLHHIEVMTGVNSLAYGVIHLLQTLDVAAEILETVIPHQVLVGVRFHPEVGPATLQDGKVIVFPGNAWIDWSLQRLQIHYLFVNLCILVLALNVIDGSNQGFDVISKLLNLEKETTFKIIFL